MKTPKELLRHKESGLTLLEWQVAKWRPHFSEILILGGHQIEGCIRVSDPIGYEGEGPLAALLAATQAATNPWVAILAVDCPEFPPELFQRAVDVADDKDQVVVYQDHQERTHWLNGLYRRSLAPDLQSSLQKGERAVKRFAANLKVRTLSHHLEDSAFFNLNSPDQLAYSSFRYTS